MISSRTAVNDAAQKSPGRERVTARVARDERPVLRELDAHKSLLQLRRDLVQRNANPQMVAERLLFGLRDAVA